MKVSELWIEAAQVAEMWAGLGRASSKRMSPIDRKITEETARHMSLLAKSFRQIAMNETRVIDLDDAPTPTSPEHEVEEYQVEFVEPIDDDPTDPD